MRGSGLNEDELLAMRRERSRKQGDDAEKELMAILGRAARRVSPEEDMFGHYDIEVKLADGEWHTVDVKSVQRRSNKHDDEVWVEMKNVHGKFGWLFGDADYIAFGLQEYWVFVHRKDLQALVRNRCGSIKAMVNHSDTPRRYKYYSRKGRDDLVTLISIEDLMAIKPELIKKRRGS